MEKWGVLKVLLARFAAIALFFLPAFLMCANERGSQAALGSPEAVNARPPSSALPAMTDETAPRNPKLLLSPKLLRRLKRDRERQTVRWTAFETRVKTVTDSPERGFELALHYAVTGDEVRGKEALMWATSHPCERRQLALIRDWVGPITSASCPTEPSLRDQAFQLISAGLDSTDLLGKVRSEFVPRFSQNGISNPADLYAAIELVSVLRTATGDDVRNAAATFFRNLPVEFLLSLNPGQVEKPDWRTHVAALALVSLDPNLEASQFLQGWAIEDRQVLHEGPGVAYELLWADPYLPGIAYQNLDPWLYDQEGARLFARSDWTPKACWVKLDKAGVKDLNCQSGWQERPVHFGSLTLLSMPSKCIDLEHIEMDRRDTRQNLVIWKLAAGESLGYRDRKDDKKEIIATADSSGIWHPGSNVGGKVCRR